MERSQSTIEPASRRERLVDYLSLERNVSIASAAVFLLGLGEELWKKFLPKYLEALGASTPVIGSSERPKISSTPSINTRAAGSPIDSVVGRAFLIFVALASAGYLIYYFASSWPLSLSVSL